MAKTRKNSVLAMLQSKAQTDGGICVKCKVRIDKLTVDHIIPVDVLKTLDSSGNLVDSWYDNFELVCAACNSFKANHLDKTNPKTIPLLKELLKRLEEDSIGVRRNTREEPDDITRKA